MDHITLPSPVTSGTVSIEEALSKRRSIREFDGRQLSTEQLSQILWAAHGITDAEGRRTAPSAGATDPLQVLVATPDGMFRYDAAAHQLEILSQENLLAEIGEALGDDRVRRAGAVVAIAADERPTTARYDERGKRYVMFEVGHVAQNLLLQVAALGLGGYPIGAFDDSAVATRFSLTAEQEPMYVISVGHPA